MKKVENVNLKGGAQKLGKGASEFKEFITRGNVLDLAVGVIIGGAFGKIVSSLVDDILMPIVGSLIGGLDFTSLSIKIGDARIMYGSFIQQVVDFLIIALCIFFIVKLASKFTKKKEEEAPKKADEVVLLEEIRDLLKETKKK
ncbi:MAG: large-conductance mechanosensitive channel protein MscL [Bacilli bacterium]|nr:large-conductance mechanosensitive channel protein MscL [Bacilli bacterium]